MMDKVSRMFTEPHGFTGGIEGPACDVEGNLYAVNYAKDHTIGKVTPEGTCSIYLELEGGSKGNGIRFNREGDMFIADYTNHNILRVKSGTKQMDIFAHEPLMNQPNDIAITKSGVLFASDPNWKESSGQLWRISAEGETALVEKGMGTTNGIEVSPDERRLYVNETVQRKIWVYDLTPEFDVVNKRLFCEFDDYGMDGMRCDMAGNLYVTRYGKGTVAVISPEGELLHEVQLGGKHCTNLTFGGADGKTCYVTIADHGNIELFRTSIPGRCWGMWR